MLHLLLGASRLVLPAATQAVSHLSEAVSRGMSVSLVRYQQQLGLSPLSKSLLDDDAACTKVHARNNNTYNDNNN